MTRKVLVNTGNLISAVSQTYCLEPNLFLLRFRVRDDQVSFVDGEQRRSSRRGMRHPERLRHPMEQRKRVR